MRQAWFRASLNINKSYQGLLGLSIRTKDHFVTYQTELTSHPVMDVVFNGRVLLVSVCGLPIRILRILLEQYPNHDRPDIDQIKIPKPGPHVRDYYSSAPFISPNRPDNNIAISF